MNPFDVQSSNPFDSPGISSVNPFDDFGSEQPEPPQTTNLSFEDAVNQEVLSSGINAAESYANNNPKPLAIDDRKALSGANVETKKDYITSGQREADQAEKNLFDAFGQGLKGGALSVARSLNFAGGLEPITGQSNLTFKDGKTAQFNNAYDPAKADDQLAAASKKLNAESNYPLKDPRFWIKNATQLGTQIGVAALSGSPLTAAATFQTSEALNTYDEVLKETGDKPAAMKAGYWTGAINSLLDTIGLKGVTGSGKQFATRVLGAMGKEGSTETAQSLVTALTKDYQILKSQGLNEDEIQKHLQANSGKYGKNAAIEGFVGSVLGGGANVVLGSSSKKETTGNALADAVSNANSPNVGPVPEFISEPTIEPFTASPDTEIDSLSGDVNNAGSDSLRATTFLDKLIEPISSTLGKIDKRIPQRLRRMQYNQNQTIMSQHKVMDRFDSWYKRASPDEKKALHEALLNDDLSALPLIAGQDGIDLAQILQNNKNELETVNRNSNPDEFAPLMSKDQASFNRLLKAFNGQKIDPMRSNSTETKVLKRAKAELVNNPNSDLSQFIEKNTLSPLTAIRKQIVDDVEGVQFARLLGDDPNNQQTSIKAIGKDLDAQQTAKINDILKSYRANKKSHGLGSTAKNLTLIDTLGSPLNALSQLGDVGSSAYMNGVWNAVTETIKAVTGKSDLNQQDLGIQSGKMDAELGDIEALGLSRWTNIKKLFSKESWNSTSKVVNSVFDLSGFTTMDAVGKRSMINSTAKKLRSQANNKARKLYDELRPLFNTEAETKNVIRDLRQANPKQYSDDTKFVLFSKLLDIQPIENSEVSQAYLEAGNGRLLYTLKTFALRRLDFIRKESLSKIARGNMKEKAVGVKNLAKIVVLLGGSEAAIDQLKELVKTGEFKDEEFIDTMVGNLAQMLFTSDYKQSGNDPIKSHLEGMLPVIKFPASLVQDVNKFRKDGKFEVNSKGMFEKQAGNFNLADAKSLKSVPLVGELYSNWAGYDKQRRSNKASSLQSDYSEAKRIARVDVEKSGSKQDLKRYRFLTKHNSSVSKITSKINKLKEYERRTGRKKTSDIEKLDQQRDQRISVILKQLEEM